MSARELQLQQIHTQLAHWQENLAIRVAGEAASFEVEIDKLHDEELETAGRLLRTAHSKILVGCDMLRDLRRQLQDRPE